MRFVDCQTAQLRSRQFAARGAFLIVPQLVPKRARIDPAAESRAPVRSPAA
jgi:hypothetical protein